MSIRNLARLLALTFAVVICTTAAFAQFPNLPANSVMGRGAIPPQGGPGQAIKFSDLIASLLSGGFTTSTVTTNSVVFKGSSSGQATVQAQAAAGTPTILLPNTSGTLADSAVFPLALNSVTGAMSCPTCSSQFATTRLAATALDLHAATIIQTGGYATAGDGGGATFKNVGSAAFKDTYVTTFSITTPGSGLTNGAYLGVALTGGSSAGCMGSAGVSGNVLTSISFAMYCSGYKVGDVLTIPTSFIGGAGVAPTVTVTAISTSQASFTDSVGTHFQYVTDQAGIANILQFGAAGDWAGTDGTATNNLAAAWSAAAWANNQYTAVISGAGGGSQVLWPKGAYMICGSWNSSQFVVPIPQYTRFSGPATGATAIVECAANSSNLFLFALCDSNSQFGQYGCKLENMMIDSQQVTTATSGTAAIYSNSGQQFVLGENLEIQPGLRGCIKYEIGKGGASNDIWLGIDCEQSQGATNPGFSFNASSTQHFLSHSVIGCTGTGCSTGIENFNGRLIVDGLELENYAFGLIQNVSTSGNISIYRNVQQNSNNCTGAIALTVGNTPGNILLENIADTCPVTISNGQSGGTNFTGNIVKPITCVSGACN
jgi:hypothetical protein